MHTDPHTNIDRCAHTRAHNTHTCPHMDRCVHTCTHTHHTYMYKYVHTCVFTVHTHVHTYTCVHTYAYIQTQTQVFVLQRARPVRARIPAQTLRFLQAGHPCSLR